MAVLGKRKSREQGEVDSKALEDAQAIFRQHFEARFAPLQNLGSQTPYTEQEIKGEFDDEDDSSNSEWDGLSGTESSDEESEPLEVVDHTSNTAAATVAMTKRESRAYLSSRPPDLSEQEASSRKSKARPAAKGDPYSQDEDSATLLANDLALQRMLSESHLFSGPASATSLSSMHMPAATGSSDGRPFAEGRTRLKATDMRIRALGGASSSSPRLLPAARMAAGAADRQQARMPMAMRQGMAAAATAREIRRRREARENGVVLERAAGSGQRQKELAQRRRRREGRAIDLPGVGRMRGAELRISKRDVISIVGRSSDKDRRRKKRR